MIRRNALDITSLFCALVLASVAGAQPIYSNASSDPSTPALGASRTSASGITAATGTFWSETGGSTSEANLNAGYSCSWDASVPVGGTFRIADDLAVTGDFGWRLSSATFYVYVPGYTNSLISPIGSANVRVWDRPPGAPGAVLVYGDDYANRMVSSIATNNFRIFNSRPLPYATAPSTSRRIWAVTVDLGTYIYTPGTYWIDLQVRCTSSDFVAYAVPATRTGARSTVGANAMTLAPSGLDSQWVPIVDSGKPFLALDAAQDLAFSIDGLIITMPCAADFNNDGGVDGDDVVAFFRAWENGQSSADVNLDGGVDGDDISAFFRLWEAGGC